LEILVIDNYIVQFLQHVSLLLVVVVAFEHSRGIKMSHNYGHHVEAADNQ